MPAPKRKPPNGVNESAREYGTIPATYLLDVNVLIAILDPLHVHHARAHAWFDNESSAWSTCALTQNGLLRLMAHPRYSNPVTSVAEAAPLLAKLCGLPGHRFWPCDYSLLDASLVDAHRLLNSSQITDTYLLALAVKHGGKLATFDKRLVADAVHGGKAALHVIT